MDAPCTLAHSRGTGQFHGWGLLRVGGETGGGTRVGADHQGSLLHCIERPPIPETLGCRKKQICSQRETQGNCGSSGTILVRNINLARNLPRDPPLGSRTANGELDRIRSLLGVKAGIRRQGFLHGQGDPQRQDPLLAYHRAIATPLCRHHRPFLLLRKISPTNQTKADAPRYSPSTLLHPEVIIHLQRKGS